MFQSFFFAGITISAVWVYWDATRLQIGKIAGRKGMFNMSAGGWGAVTLGLWIIGFPAYLLQRAELKRLSQSNPVEVKGRIGKLLVIAALGAAWSIASFASPTAKLPLCGSAEVSGVAERIFRAAPGVKASGVAIISVTSSEEYSYDPGKQRRVCHAVLKTNRGQEKLAISVFWRDQAKGEFQVQVGSPESVF